MIHPPEHHGLLEPVQTYPVDPALLDNDTIPREPGLYAWWTNAMPFDPGGPADRHRLELPLQGGDELWHLAYIGSAGIRRNGNLHVRFKNYLVFRGNFRNVLAQILWATETLNLALCNHQLDRSPMISTARANHPSNLQLQNWMKENMRFNISPNIDGFGKNDYRVLETDLVNYWTPPFNDRDVPWTYKLNLVCLKNKAKSTFEFAGRADV